MKSTALFLKEALKVLPMTKPYEIIRANLMPKLVDLTQMPQNQVAIQICNMCGVNFNKIIPHQTLIPVKHANRFLRRCFRTEGIHKTKCQAVAVTKFRKRYENKQKLLIVCKLCGKQQTKSILKPRNVLTLSQMKKSTENVKQNNMKKKKRRKNKNKGDFAGLNADAVKSVNDTLKQSKISHLYEGFSVVAPTSSSCNASKTPKKNLKRKRSDIEVIDLITPEKPAKVMKASTSKINTPRKSKIKNAPEASNKLVLNPIKTNKKKTVQNKAVTKNEIKKKMKDKQKEHKSISNLLLSKTNKEQNSSTLETFLKTFK